MDGGEFPMSLGTFMTIPKAPRGGAIAREQSFYLDIVHVDIAFGIVSPQVAFDNPSFLLIEPLITTGCLVSRICRMLQFLRLSDCFGQMQVCMLVASVVIATQNFLGQKLGNTLLIMLPTSLLPLQAANLPTV
jgi:hypothetical protein